MHAMILAAGRGTRMRPLTDHTPKPLLEVGGKPLIVWHLERLARTHFKKIVINHAHLGQQIEQKLGDGRNWQLEINYSPEPTGALETAGGIAQAIQNKLLPEHEPFLVINGDVFCDWDTSLAHQFDLDTILAHLVLIDNPTHNPQGDFTLSDHSPNAHNSQIKLIKNQPNPSVNSAKLTFSGIGIYHPDLFSNIDTQKPTKLAPLLKQAESTNQLSGEHYCGRWVDVGTPERLQWLDEELKLKN